MAVLVVLFVALASYDLISGGVASADHPSAPRTGRRGVQGRPRPARRLPSPAARIQRLRAPLPARWQSAC